MKNLSQIIALLAEANKVDAGAKFYSSDQGKKQKLASYLEKLAVPEEQQSYKTYFGILKEIFSLFDLKAKSPFAKKLNNAFWDIFELEVEMMPPKNAGADFRSFSNEKLEQGMLHFLDNHIKDFNKNYKKLVPVIRGVDSTPLLLDSHLSDAELKREEHKELKSYSFKPKLNR